MQNTKTFFYDFADRINFLGWFDSVFFAYNILLFSLALLIPPMITFVYIRLMKGEKYRRLRSDIPAVVWDRGNSGTTIEEQINKLFRWRVYFGSLALLMAVLVLGISIMLFLKPLISVDPDVGPLGVDYSKGANMLMLGPYAVHDPAEYFPRLVISLAAFQYGFLGAYTHHIGQLARSYFMLDLTPHTYVDATVRIAMGSLVALVVSFWFFNPAEFDNYDSGQTLLPVVRFFLGFFPTRGLLLIEKLATAAVKVLPATTYQAEGLSKLPGMSYAHELRLGREGFDTIENLMHANSLDLAVRTGFSYCQLEQWKGQAWLCGHMRDDYETFMKRTGLTSRQDLRAFKEEWESTARNVSAASQLAGDDASLRVKIEAILTLVDREIS